jgi:hypothetical protein
MTGFKGTRNENGRPKGAKNKTTIEIREQIQWLVEDNLDLLNEDLKGLEPKDRIAAIIHLAKFILPTLKAQEIIPIEDPLNPTVIHFEFGELITPERAQEVKRIFNEDY